MRIRRTPRWKKWRTFSPSACCDEEEELLRDVCLKKRQEQGIAADCFVHFDIPLTLEHETEIMKKVGFHIEKVLEDPDGATIILAWKKD